MNCVHPIIHIRSNPHCFAFQIQNVQVWNTRRITPACEPLYEYFGLIFLFYSDDHDPMHLHVQHGDREGIIMLIIVEGKLVELRWRAKRGADMLKEKEQREAEAFIRAMKDDSVAKWTAFYVEHKRISTERITRRIK